MDQYVDASGLGLGFALWQVGANGMTTLVEGATVPRNGTTTTYTVDATLEYGTEYRWRGRGVLDGAYGPWSDLATFMTGPAPPPPPPAPMVPSDPQAVYIAIFESDWSAATHPTDYTDNAHYSPMIGATHNRSVQFWQNGMLATPGIENMAETGSQSPLDGEMQAAINSGMAGSIFRGRGLAPTPRLENVQFTATTDFSYVTLVSRIAPSPDWFVGVNSVPLIANDEWRQEIVISLFPWDAGTDNGPSYDSVDVDTVTAQPISLLQGDPVVKNGTVAPFGRFIFRRLQ